jgi:hypothetical protein
LGNGPLEPVAQNTNQVVVTVIQGTSAVGGQPGSQPPVPPGGKAGDKVSEKKDEKADSSTKPLGDNKDVRTKTYCN